MDKHLTPDVSVIIATYNVQTYIERAIRSALDQQGVSVEVIVVDDKSTDDTVSIASRINDPRIKIIRRANNGGPSVTRNEGFTAASGSWIAVLDGDDAFAPHRLARCLALAQAIKADIVIDNLEVHRESDSTHYPMFQSKDFGGKKTLTLATFIRGNVSFLGGSSLGYVKPIFSAAFLQKHQLSYDPNIRIGEDYMLLSEALACGARCKIDPSCGYLYTVRATSISHRLSVLDIERMVNSDKKFLAKYTLDPSAQKAQRKRTSSMHKVLAFTKLVDTLKHKNFYAASKLAATHPIIMLYLWKPLWARMNRLFGHSKQQNKTTGVRS